MIDRHGSRKRIAVVSLGGTITMTTQASGGVVPSLTSKDLLATLALAEFDLEIEPITLKKLPGAHLTPQGLVELAADIDKLDADGYAGVVVTQGTDTIEETAFALDHLATRAIPIVVTGAMRSAQTIRAFASRHASKPMAASPLDSRAKLKRDRR